MKERRTVEFGGGLGDIFIDMFRYDLYTRLDTLSEGERAQVVLRSANPGVRDLFQWHPKAPYMDIIDVGAGDPYGPEQRQKLGIGDPTPSGLRNGSPVNFYPSKGDLDLLSFVRRPYVVFAVSAGIPLINIPLRIAEKAADIAIERGITVVAVGKTYANVIQDFDKNTHTTIPHEEVRLRPRRGILDTIDRLSVPGLALLVRDSAATFSCHSSLLSLSWNFRKPVFCLYHESKRWEWVEGAGSTWGRHFPETRGVCLGDWDPSAFLEFVSRYVG